jgi:uncharacterized protein with beta-barrel porin domain
MSTSKIKLGGKVDVVMFSVEGGAIVQRTVTIVDQTAAHWLDGKGRRYTKRTGKLSDPGAEVAQYAVPAGTARTLTMSPGQRAAYKAWQTMRAAA